jgi:hypothetical protein
MKQIRKKSKKNPFVFSFCFFILFSYFSFLYSIFNFLLAMRDEF